MNNFFEKNLHEMMTYLTENHPIFLDKLDSDIHKSMSIFLLHKISQLEDKIEKLEAHIEINSNTRE
jgi:vesicle coat complex subunit